MATDVKPRAYHSARRQEQAAATRRMILAAAQTLFARDGYRATTMAAVAAQAGVALKTVYLAFQSKGGLLHALWDVALGGDDTGIPVAARRSYLEVLDAKDPAQQLRLNARNSRAAKQRIAPVLAMIRDGARVDADVDTLWQLIQREYHDNQRVIVESIAAKGALRPGLDIEQATDILWWVNHPDTWQLLVGQRGWTPERYEQWSGDLACAQLLPAPRAERKRRTTVQ